MNWFNWALFILWIFICKFYIDEKLEPVPINIDPLSQRIEACSKLDSNGDQHRCIEMVMDNKESTVIVDSDTWNK